MVTLAPATSTNGSRPMDDAEFERWARLLETRTGVIVPPERKPFLETGLRRRMRVTGHTQFDSYYDSVSSGSGGALEWASLVDHLTVHETHFFRHLPSFDLIREQWLPSWLGRAAPADSVHALSVGCSTGEEAYSLALLLDVELSKTSPVRRFGVTATDVSQSALGVARTAEYPMRRYAELPAAYRAGVDVLPDGENFCINERLRKRVGFACVNLLHASRAPLRKLDIIFCQNVLIYFARERRRELLDGLAGLVQPGGLLVLGPGEAPGWSHPQMRKVGGPQTLAFVRNM